MTGLTPDIERVQEWVDFLAAHAIHALVSNGSDGRTRWSADCLAADCSWQASGDGKIPHARAAHDRHLAEQIAALVEQAEGDHLAAFLAQLPGDLFSETEIQRVREWAGEWSG